MNLQENLTCESNYLERFEILRATTAGMFRSLLFRLDALQRYLDLLEDDVEASSAGKVGMRHLNTCRETLANIVSDCQDAEADIPLSDWTEKLNLAAVAEGVIGQYARITGCDEDLKINIPQDIFVKGNAYQLQQLIFDIIDCLDSLHKDSKPAWNINGEIRNFSETDAVSLQMACCPPGEYVLLSLLRPGLGADDLGGFLSLLGAIGKRLPLPYSQMNSLYWQGSLLGQGGDILVPVQSLDSGLIILLPLADDQDEQLPAAASLGGKTILLVDDEDMIWDVITAMLQDLGYNVLLAGNGLEAIETYRSNPGGIDLVLLDMLMPELSGRETFLRLKEINPEVKVLLSSGYVSGGDVQDVLNAGAAGFLQKPYRMTELSAKIREILQ